jgi:hypothetical protein
MAVAQGKGWDPISLGYALGDRSTDGNSGEGADAIKGSGV